MRPTTRLRPIVEGARQTHSKTSQSASGGPAISVLGKAAQNDRKFAPPCQLR